jgi:hypothetical protein
MEDYSELCDVCGKEQPEDETYSCGECGIQFCGCCGRPDMDRCNECAE